MSYVTPVVEVIEVEVENGFAESKGTYVNGWGEGDYYDEDVYM